jgi:hypothetical protein
MDDASCFSKAFEELAAGDYSSPDGRSDGTVGRIRSDRESHGT